MTPEQFTACAPVEDLSADASADPIAAAPPVAPSVAALLKRSRAHHDAKRKYANRTPPNYAKAEAEIAHALALRLQAHDLDPAHTDPEWAHDAVPHAALVAFYERYGDIP